MQPTNSNTFTPWQMCMSLSQSIHMLHTQLDKQQALIDQLSKQLDSLNERIKTAESKPVYHIDSMAYHFDQLKVEKLDGTLNIGMTPPSGETFKEIGQMVVPGTPPQTVQHPNSEAVWQQNTPFGNIDTPPQTTSTNQFPVSDTPLSPHATQPKPPYPEIRVAVDDYLNNHAPFRLSQLEAAYGVSLDPYHRRLVIEDIRKQMSARIQYYMNTTQQTEPAKDTAQIKPEVITKTTRDIDAAFHNYLSKLQAATNQNP